MTKEEMENSPTYKLEMLNIKIYNDVVNYTEAYAQQVAREKVEEYKRELLKKIEKLELYFMQVGWSMHETCISKDEVIELINSKEEEKP